MHTPIKIASAQAAIVAARGAATLRSLSEKVASLEDENLRLRQHIAQRQHEDAVREIAHEMEAKGLNPSMTFEDKVAHIARYDDLGTVRHAVGMAAGNEIRFAKVADAPGNAAFDSLTALCLGAEF